VWALGGSSLLPGWVGKGQPLRLSLPVTSRSQVRKAGRAGRQAPKEHPLQILSLIPQGALE